MSNRIGAQTAATNHRAGAEIQATARRTRAAAGKESAGAGRQGGETGGNPKAEIPAYVRLRRGKRRPKEVRNPKSEKPTGVSLRHFVRTRSFALPSDFRFVS